jgi:NADH-quinone oxidoreductase subunit M
MSNLLSLVTFIPLVAAVILALLSRGDSEDSQRSVVWV